MRDRAKGQEPSAEAQELSAQNPADPSMDLFRKYTGSARRGAQAQARLFLVDFEITTHCAGGCLYCYNTSSPQTGFHMPTEKILSLVDELLAMGIRQITWCGGDPLAHPAWEEVAIYAASKGLRNNLYGSAIISKKNAERIVTLPNVRMVGMHIDTIDPGVYRLLHREGRTLPLKVQSYHNLLEAGHPREWVSPCICLTKFSAASVEQTLDWFIDQMGARYVPILIFKPQGLGHEFRDWAPTPEQIWHAYSYRAKKLGDQWLALGTSECGQYNCRTKFYLTSDGEVLPCGSVPRSFSAGNVYREKLADIFQRRRDELLFNFVPAGPCGECEHSDVCFGCRSNAYHFSGDIQASDPMCFKYR